MSKAFYETISFTKVQLMVDDLDAWWAHIAALDLAAAFGVASLGLQRCNLGVYASPMSSIQPACCGMSPNAGWETMLTGEPGLKRKLDGARC